MAIELRKTGDKHRINLEKTKAFPGEIKINLDWSKGGFMKKLFGGAIIILPDFQTDTIMAV